jgi:S1-C subfamily serine protease
MEVGDIITACQGEEITSMNVLSGIINDYYAGDTITLTVYRGNLYTPVDIVLSAQPDGAN